MPSFAAKARASKSPTDMDLHHPPCMSLVAHEVFHALGRNPLQAIKLIHLPDRDQCPRIRTLLHILMLIPVRFKHHARQLKVVRCVSGCWLRWWNRFITELTAEGADVPPARGSSGSSLKPDHPPCIRPEPGQLKPINAPQRHGPNGRIHAPGRSFHPRK